MCRSPHRHGYYREKVWRLPASDLLYVGPATTRKLAKVGIYTIGDLAHANLDWVRHALGKNGIMLYSFANGWDNARVMPSDYHIPIKSVGHGTTCVVDLDNDYSVWLVLLELAQDIGKRLRENSLSAKGVQLAVKDNTFNYREYNVKLPYATQSPLEVAQAAYALFKERYEWINPVRALTVRGTSLEDEKTPVQLDVFNDYAVREKRKALDDAIYDIRRRFGSRSICSASLLGELNMAKDKCDTVLMPSMMFM